MSGTYVLLTVPEGDESLMAILSEAGFEAFEETETHIVGYLPSALYTSELKAETDLILQQFEKSGDWSQLPDQNWNELWESNFSPVEVPGVCRVRAEFHPSDPDYQYEITIQPRMAFGTGHHQTTYMMLKQMSGLDWAGKTVFDFGCGTGILAIFASMLGAERIVANDIEHESFVNTQYNAQVNGVSNIEALQGGLEVITDQKFDVILANINRNVLIASASRLSSLLAENGQLLLSGILETDFDVIVTSFEEVGLKLKNRDQMDAWLCLEMSPAV